MVEVLFHDDEIVTNVDESLIMLMIVERHSLQAIYCVLPTMQGGLSCSFRCNKTHGSSDRSVRLVNYANIELHRPCEHETVALVYESFYYVLFTLSTVLNRRDPHFIPLQPKHVSEPFG